MNNFIKDFVSRKKRIKSLFHHKDFHNLWIEFVNEGKVGLITEEKYIDMIDSIFENKRNEIFYIPNQKYSLIYKGYIIEKYYEKTTHYCVFLYKDYLKNHHC